MDQLAKIKQLRTLLQSGAKTVVVDGLTVSLDREDLKRELIQLEIAAGLWTRILT